MKTKVMIPALAFVFAIGMSFATEKSTADAENDWVQIGPNRVMIEEVDCGVPVTTCTGQFDENGPEYPIYDAKESTEPKQGAGLLDELLIPIG